MRLCCINALNSLDVDIERSYAVLCAREYAQRYNIKYFYDIKDLSDFRANPDYKGVCHVALAQEGHCRPGEVLLGTDSHTCNAGAFGQFATGVGNTDAGFVLGTGQLLLKVLELGLIYSLSDKHYVLDGSAFVNLYLCQGVSPVGATHYALCVGWRDAKVLACQGFNSAYNWRNYCCWSNLSCNGVQWFSN